ASALLLPRDFDANLAVIGLATVIADADEVARVGIDASVRRDRSREAGVDLERRAGKVGEDRRRACAGKRHFGVDQELVPEIGTHPCCEAARSERLHEADADTAEQRFGVREGHRTSDIRSIIEIEGLVHHLHLRLDGEITKAERYAALN